jgi:DNA-binding NarL/FixJ family response regulator
MAQPAAELVQVTEKTRRVLLVDDHDVVRKGLRLLIERELGVEVLEAATAADGVTWGRDPSIDLVLLDVRMPERDGLWVLDEIRKARPEVPVIMLSTYTDEDYVYRSIEAGANGYLPKEASTHQLREAVETALHHRGLYLHPSVAHRALRRRRDGERYEEMLSERELAVLQLVADGETNERIAATLYVSEKTVKSHLSSIYRKLEVTNRTQAASKAIREKIVRDADAAPVA